MNVFREFMEGVFSNPDNNKIFEFLLNFKSCFLSVGANLLLAQTFVPSFLPLSLSLSLFCATNKSHLQTNIKILSCRNFPS